ncbi:MAG: M1 family metallopeptidase [Planctomycetota bacterium]|nr:M1 family metallopeptidase [Planctomycetota bacterium]
MIRRWPVPCLLALCGCAIPRPDPHSFSRPDQIAVRHLELDIRVDFDARQISGKVRLHLERRTPATYLVLDIDGLTVHRVTRGEDERPAPFVIGEEDPVLGRPLRIEVGEEASVVTVHYTTSPGASALQWLEPPQTAGKKRPFLYTQSQPILARSWIPCQDTPGVRMTYRARVRVPAGLMAVMSAENARTRTPDGIYRFHMPQPVPSYLLALAVGDLEFREISDRCGVFAEPAVLDRAAWEFADTERMLRAAEKLYGPYRWERYDILVLPPSFPWGGMENPRLTFCTPTVLAGDRSLVSLIAHELAHSWSGNLVTGSTWNDFWLNEGFTVYLEHRIMEELYGREYDDMLVALGYRSLLEEIDALAAEAPEDTHLRLDLSGRDPDDGLTDIPYEKGYFFLRSCEAVVGRQRWDEFLRRYFDTFAFQSMTSDGFLAYARRELVQGDPRLEAELELEAWVDGPGLPENVARPPADAFARVDRELEKWRAGEAAETLDVRRWSTHEWLHFLRALPPATPAARLSELDERFRLTETANHEILARWLLIAVASDYRAARERLEAFLKGVGRLKFIEPLYQRLASTAEGREEALRIYRRARPGYHPIAVEKIDALLGWETARRE